MEGRWEESSELHELKADGQFTFMHLFIRRKGVGFEKGSDPFSSRQSPYGIFFVFVGKERNALESV
jgi:hypothetical protein